MKYLAIIFLIFMIIPTLGFFQQKQITKEMTCEIDIPNFPKQITGKVTLELNNHITILVESETQKIEITFNKERCK